MDAASRHEQEAHANAINSMKGLGLPYPGLGSLHHLTHPHQQPSHHPWSSASAAAAASHAQLMANHLNGLMRPGHDAMSVYASSLQGHLSSSLL